MRYIPGRIPVILAVSNLFFTCAVSVDLTIATLVGYISWRRLINWRRFRLHSSQSPARSRVCLRPA